MKLLLDNNLSFRLLDSLKKEFSEVVHLVELELDSASDFEVADYALDNDMLIVTKDRDFVEIARRHSRQLKIILIRRGNCSTKDIEKILLGSAREIRKFSLMEDMQILKLV